MSLPLPLDEIYFETNVCLEDIMKTPDDGDILGFFNEVDLRYPNNLRQKAKHFPLCPESKIMSKKEFNEYMKKN